MEIKDTTSTLATSWEFADATTIADVNTARPGDKWSRTSYGNADITGASDTFLACAGNPAAGSLKNIIPFSDDNQYYQVSVLFAAHNYKSYTVTANVKVAYTYIAAPEPATNALLLVGACVIAAFSMKRRRALA